MYKKLVFLVTLALVLGLAGNASGVLVGRWLFDGDACDTSGSVPSHDGTIMVGDANTSIGFIYDAERGRNVLDVNNPLGHTVASLVDCNGNPNDISDPDWAGIQNAITIGCWTKVRTMHLTNYLMAKGAPYQWTACPFPAADGRARLFFNNTTDTAQYSTSSFDDLQWHHIVATYDPCGTTERKLYWDGEVETTEAPVHNALGWHVASFTIGGRADGTFLHRGWDGLISDVRLYDSVLATVDIRAWAENDKTFDPVPSDGAVDQDQQLAQVTWSGQPATSAYRVYFGTDEALVTDACDLVDKDEVGGSGASGSYTLGTLAYGEVYYWRADANMSGTVHEGYTWEFTVAYGKTTQHDPWDGSKYVSTSKQLSWKLGYGAENTYMYFSTNQQWVEDACDSILTIIGEPTNTYSPVMAADISYYWRADSNAGGALYFPGDVLTFSTDTTSPDAGLVGYWPMDETFGGSTVTWDISGNAHHGTFKQGSASTTIGIVSDTERGNVLDVNNVVGSAINSVVQCGGGGTGGWAAMQDQITLMAWTKVDSWHETHYMITRGSPYQMTMNNSNGNLRTYWNNLSDQYQYGYVFLDDGEWHHVAMTYDSTSVPPERKVYTDGALQSTEFPSGTLGASSEGFVIGGRDSLSYDERGFDGFFDDVKLYNVIHPCWKIVAEGTQCGTCVGDLDASNQVNLTDLNILIGDLTSAKLRPPDEWEILPGDD